MLTAGQFYDVLCAVVPLYVALFLGYGSLKWWGVMTLEQSAGLSRLNTIVALPPLVFEIIAFNNPYAMNNRLIAAYCLANVAVLVVLVVWACCTKCGTLDWVITLFQLSVMPNTIIVGIPVLSPLYSITSSGIAAVFIGQVLWLFPVLFLYELRAVRKQGQQPVVGQPAIQNVHAAAGLENGGHELQEEGIPVLMTQAERGDACRIQIGEHESAKEGEQMTNGIPKRTDSRDSNDVQPVGLEVGSSPLNIKEMASRVGMKMVKLPLTYATVLGIIYSLIAGRWDFGPPRLLRNSLDLTGRIALGLTMYNIGIFMASQEKLVASWWVASYGAFCRFIVGPGIMGLASLCFGLQSDPLRFAILQLHYLKLLLALYLLKTMIYMYQPSLLAVSIQTIVFMPIVLGYFLLLEL